MNSQPVLPAGFVPAGVRIEPAPQFSPELQAALKKARDESGGRWSIAIFTAGEKGDPVNLHFTRGKEWSDNWFIMAYRLFVAEFLKFEPEMFDGIHAGEAPAAVPTDGGAGDTGVVANVPGADPAEPGKAAAE